LNILELRINKPQKRTLKRNMLKEIRLTASEKPEDPDKSKTTGEHSNKKLPQETFDSKKAKKDLIYVDNVLSAIYACERNILSILRGRDLNFKQTDQLMENQIKNIESSDRLSKDLHSSIPRLFATGTGAAGTVFVGYLLSFFNVNIPDTVLYAAAVVGAGLF
jgi:hypothetical protein